MDDYRAAGTPKTATMRRRLEAGLHAIGTISPRDADRDRFFATLASPPEPTAALKRLFTEERRRKA